MALNFMIHCGGAEVGRDQLHHATPPEATATYMPIAHTDFADLISDTIEAHDFRLGETAHALGRKGDHYFGMAELLYSGQEEDFALIAGWRSSYDKSLSAGLVIGSQVFVCDNLCFSGDVKIGRKHTTNLWDDLPEMIWDAVSEIIPARDAQVRRFNAYKEDRIGEKQMNSLVVDLYRNGVIPARMLGPVIEEFYNPSHPEFLENDRTLWTLFNGVTEVIKGSSLWELPQRTQKLHALFDNEINFDGYQYG
jgi:hypothetical protein